MNRLAVSYASGRYRRGQERLIESLARVGMPCFHDYETVSGESGKYTPHSRIPYAFKPEIMLVASEPDQTLLWADASVLVNGSLDPICEHVEKHGYLLLSDGWNNAQFSNDQSLAAFGYTRDEAEKQPQAMSRFFGVSTSHPRGRFLLAEWHAQKALFAGSHYNNQQTESKDPRCRGHRHDQTVLSLIAARHGYEVIQPPMAWYYYGRSPDRIINIDGSVNA